MFIDDIEPEWLRDCERFPYPNEGEGTFEVSYFRRTSMAGDCDLFEEDFISEDHARAFVVEMKKQCGKEIFNIKIKPIDADLIIQKRARLDRGFNKYGKDIETKCNAILDFNLDHALRFEANEEEYMILLLAIQSKKYGFKVKITKNRL